MKEEGGESGKEQESLQKVYKLVGDPHRAGSELAPANPVTIEPNRPEKCGKAVGTPLSENGPF